MTNLNPFFIAIIISLFRLFIYFVLFDNFLLLIIVLFFSSSVFLHFIFFVVVDALLLLMLLFPLPSSSSALPHARTRLSSSVAKLHCARYLTPPTHAVEYCFTAGNSFHCLPGLRRGNFCLFLSGVFIHLAYAW